MVRIREESDPEARVPMEAGITYRVWTPSLVAQSTRLLCKNRQIRENAVRPSVSRMLFRAFSVSV
jgi:hypothetical protein